MQAEGPVYRLQQKNGDWQLLTKLSSMEEAAQILKNLGHNTGLSEVSVELFDFSSQSFVEKDKIIVGSPRTAMDPQHEPAGWPRIMRGYSELGDKTRNIIFSMIACMGMLIIYWTYSICKIFLTFVILLLSSSEHSSATSTAQRSAIDIKVPIPSAPPIDKTTKSTKVFTFTSDDEYASTDVNDPVVRKNLATNAHNGRVEFQHFRIFKSDMSDYERGGRAYAISDDSLGVATRVTCVLSPEKSDLFARNKKILLTRLSGTIKSYDRSRGLVLDPCDYTIK